MQIVKIRINNEIVNISMPKVKSIKDRIIRTKQISKYTNFLTKIF